MSNQESDSSSEYGWRESDGDAKPSSSRKKLLIALIVMVIIMGSPWWITAIPEFGFTR